jgi:hypothetical protein
MSEALDVQNPDTGGAQVTEDDLRRMIEEANKERDTLRRDLASERSRASTAEDQARREREARIVTESERDGHATRATSEAEQRWNAEREATKANIAAQESVVASAEEAAARYAEAGDWSASMKAQRQMAEAAARLTNLQGKAEYLETNKERLVGQAPAPVRREVAAAPTGDRITQLVKDVQPAEHEWLTKRPQFLDNERYRKEVFAASGLAVARGHARGTQSYFQDIEKTLGEAPAVANADPVDPQTTRKDPPRNERAPSSDMAPQRRSAPGAAPPGRVEMKLTADEADVADSMYGQPNSEEYIPDQAKRYEKYWTNKEKLRAAGRL